jgi:hypothetical protein
LKDEKQKIKIEDMNIECVYDRDLEIEKEPDCAYGYCREDLYNRGKLPNWREMFICERCKEDLYYLEKLDEKPIDDEPFESSDFVARLERLEKYIGLPK